MDELFSEGDEVIRNLLCIRRVTRYRFVDVTESCSDWIVQKQNTCFINLNNNKYLFLYFKDESRE